MHVLCCVCVCVNIIYIIMFCSALHGHTGSVEHVACNGRSIDSTGTDWSGNTHARTYMHTHTHIYVHEVLTFIIYVPSSVCSYVRVWDMHLGRPLFSLAGHTEEIEVRACTCINVPINLLPHLLPPPPCGRHNYDGDYVGIRPDNAPLMHDSASPASHRNREAKPHIAAPMQYEGIGLGFANIV